MSGAPRSAEAEAARIKRYNRTVLSAFAVCAVVFLALPQIVIWWGSRHVCPSSVTERGKSDGTAWEILRSDCGAEGGIVWQLRVIPDKGYSAVVMESRGGPQPVGWEQSGFEGRVLLSAPPAGETATKVALKLDPKGQPMGMVAFRDGKRTN